MSVDVESLPIGGACEQSHLRTGSSDFYAAGDAARVFAVRSPSKLNDESFALYHADVPAIGDAHPTRAGLFLLNKVARQADDKNGEIWEVLCTYGIGMGLLPWQEPAIYSWGTQATEQICDFDVITNKPVRNSAGAPFDPGLTATRFEAVLTVSRNMLTFNIPQALQFVGAVNKTTFYGAKPGFCMCTGIPAAQQVYIDQRNRRTDYWSVQYVFAFRNLFSWQPKILDAGYVKKSGSGSLIPITIAGREPTSPVPLDGAGQPLANPESNDPTFLDFKVYPEQDFNALGI